MCGERCPGTARGGAGSVRTAAGYDVDGDRSLRTVCPKCFRAKADRTKWQALRLRIDRATEKEGVLRARLQRCGGRDENQQAIFGCDHLGTYDAGGAIEHHRLLVERG